MFILIFCGKDKSLAISYFNLHKVCLWQITQILSIYPSLSYKIHISIFFFFQLHKFSPNSTNNILISIDTIDNSSWCVYLFFFFFFPSSPFCRVQFEWCKIFRNPIQWSILLVRSKTISFIACWIRSEFVLSEYCKYSVICSFIIRTSCFAMSSPLKRKCCAQIRLY